jgi:hypothetical protein
VQARNRQHDQRKALVPEPEPDWHLIEQRQDAEHGLQRHGREQPKRTVDCRARRFGAD